MNDDDLIKDFITRQQAIEDKDMHIEGVDWKQRLAEDNTTMQIIGDKFRYRTSYVVKSSGDMENLNLELTAKYGKRVRLIRKPQRFPNIIMYFIEADH